MVEMNKHIPLVNNPAEKPKSQFLSEFVIRQMEFENIYDVISHYNPTTAPQHFLIAGQRGMGKTTLLLRIKYAIEDDPKLNNYLIPVRFSEEQYNIARLDRIWEETALSLEVVNNQYNGLMDEMIQYENEKDYDAIAFEVLAKWLKKNKQRVVLLIDNIGILFEKFGKQPLQTLREILTTSPYVQVVGGSAQALEHTFSYSQPFYEFFREIRLNPVTASQCIDLLRALGSAYDRLADINEIIEKAPGRIDALRKLTGGVPRTIALLFEIFVDNKNGEAFDDLQLLLDGVTHLYKHRMDDLKPQQQQIIDALARAWDPIDSKEILLKSKLGRDGIKSNQISAQLKQMVDNQIVEQIDGPVGRTKYYAIRERFFNIWYLMRHGRKTNREDVMWLVKFFETWYTMKDLKDMTVSQRRCMKDGNYSIHAAYHKAKALSMIEMEPKFKNAYLSESSEFLKRMGEIEKAEEIKGMVAEPNQYEYSIKGLHASQQRDLKLANELFIKAVEVKEPHSNYNLAYFYHMYVKDIDKAEQYYMIALDEGDVNALNNLGLIYHQNRKNIDKAIEYWKEASDKGDANAMRNLAMFYESERKDIDTAIYYYDMAAEKGDVHSMFNLALIYENEKKNIERAILYYLMAIEKGDIAAMFNLALLYENEKRDFEKAEKYFLLAIENGDINSLFCIATFYESRKKNIAKAEHYYLLAIEKGDSEAMNNLALLYQYQRNDIEKAEFYFSMAFEKGSVFAAGNLTILFLKKNDVAKAIPYAESMFKDENIYKTNLEEILNTVLEFAVKKQYHFLMNQFKKEDSMLIRHAKPFYYAIAYFLRDEMPGEYEKAGAELKETVDEIIAKIQKGQVEEAKKKED
jgi:TPR repeat protein/nucleoside-triphosphatase THEP1